jgi:PKD repeat protein
LISYVHYGVAFANAFWNGQFMTYGDGAPNTAIPQPATVLDICGHEFAHGVTGNSARLIYRNESGALNESFSDIFGKAIEHFARPNNFSWVVGGDMGTGIRNMELPHTFGNPHTYQGRFWFTGSGNNGGVHTNSGVQNKWFQLLVEGGSGTNDLFNSYSVQGIGWDSAGAIAYRNLSVYLTPNSDYSDARFYAIQSAIDLYSNCSKAQESVTRAWYAVGVGDNFSLVPQSDFSKDSDLFCSLPYEVNFQNNSTGAANQIWYFGDGDSSLAMNPTHTYASPGQYTVTLKVDGVCGGTVSETKTNFVDIQPAPMVPLVSGKTVICRNATQLIAQSNDEVAWFDGFGNLISMGDTLDVPPLSQTTTYYPRSIRANPGQFVGPADNTFGTGGFLRTDTRHITFDVLQPSVLESVKVYADGAGERVIEYRASDGTVLQSKKVMIPDGESRVPLGFLLQPGRELQLGTSGATSLYANNSNTNYPYDIANLVSITGTNASNANFYVLFYDWEVALPPCEGPEASVQVSVNAAPAPEIPGQGRCGPGPITLMSQAGDSSLRWYDQAGQLLATGPSLFLPMQSQTDSFQVERLVIPPVRHLGPQNGSIGSGNYHNLNREDYLSFTVFQPLRIKSVWVDAQQAGSRDFVLSDGQGNRLQTLTFNVPAGASRVPLELDLLPGNYRLGGTSLRLVQKL